MNFTLQEAKSLQSRRSLQTLHKHHLTGQYFVTVGTDYSPEWLNPKQRLESEIRTWNSHSTEVRLGPEQACCPGTGFGTTAFPGFRFTSFWVRPRFRTVVCTRNIVTLKLF